MSSHDYPAWVCHDCGEEYGRRNPTNATWHEGECDVCGYTNAVTQPRDFGHLVDGWKDHRDKWECPECHRRTESAYCRCDDCVMID